MMILRSSPASPFGRKVRIAISLLGFGDQTKVEPADPTDSSDSLRRQNPLGKIPVLIDQDGAAYYDSRVILDFLDERAGGGKIVPREPRQRLAALRLQALCDGILDASILPFTKAVGARASITNKNGLIIRPAKSLADSPLSNPLRRPSTQRRRPCPMSDRSRLPALSATAISVSAKTGVASIRAW